MLRAFIWYIGGLVRSNIGSAVTSTSFCSFRHASAMNIQQWWSTNFEASLVGIVMELRILWWVYMQPRHSRASLWTKTHAKRVFSSFVIVANANPLILKPFSDRPRGRNRFPVHIVNVWWNFDQVEFFCRHGMMRSTCGNQLIQKNDWERDCT